MPGPAPSIGRQLAAALAETGVSQNELAKRLAAIDGTKPESKRRWIQKLLNNQVDRPDMTEIASALSLPADYFSLAPRASRDRPSRLEELEEEVAALRRAGSALLQIVSLLTEQVRELGGAVPPSALEGDGLAAFRKPRRARRRTQ